MDSPLIAVSALDHFFRSFVEEFLPVANAHGVATVGMKVLVLGSLTHEVERLWASWIWMRHTSSPS